MLVFMSTCITILNLHNRMWGNILNGMTGNDLSNYKDDISVAGQTSGHCNQA